MRRNDSEQDDQPQDPVWSLLGRAPMPAPDGWFTARTMARLRREEHEAVGWLTRWRGILLVTGTVGVASLSVILFNGEMTSRDSSTPPRAQIQEAFASLADGSQDTEIWSDSPL